MSPPRQQIEVAIAVVRDPNGALLMAERPAGKRGAGFWEFPGGKIERSETAAAAAMRELEEELGLRATHARALRVYTHDFPAARIRLHPFLIEQWRGSASGREGQRFAWVDPANASTIGPLLASHARLHRVMSLPRRVVRLTAAHPISRASLHAAAQHGFHGFLLDAANLPPGQQILLARRISGLLPAGGMLMLRGAPQAAAAAHAHAAVAPLAQAPTAGGGAALPLFGVACAALSDLQRAEDADADFAVLDQAIAGPNLTGDRNAMPVYATMGGGNDAAGQHVLVDFDVLLGGAFAMPRAAA